MNTYANQNFPLKYFLTALLLLFFKGNRQYLKFTYLVAVN